MRLEVVPGVEVGMRCYGVLSEEYRVEKDFN